MAGDWTRLAEAITARRAELGLSQVEVQVAGGPSTSTQKSLERADATVYRRATLVDLELVLRWRPGSIAAVLAGGQPTPTDAPAGEARTVLEHLVQLRAEVSELRQLVAELAAGLPTPSTGRDGAAPHDLE